MKPKPKPVEIVGIVHPLGVGGGKLGQEKLWTLRFSFEPWQNAKGKIQESRLYLDKPKLTDAQLREQMKGISPYDILRVQVVFPPKAT